MHQLTITPSSSVGRTDISIDGNPVYARSYTLHHEVDCIPRLDLEIFTSATEIDEECYVYINDNDIDVMARCMSPKQFATLCDKYREYHEKEVNDV